METRILSDVENQVDDAILEKRWVGALMVLFGVFAANIGYLTPWVAIRNGAESVSPSIAAAVLSPILLVAGFLSLVLGSKYTRLFGTRSDPSKLGIGVYCILVLLGFAGAFAMCRYISLSGYD